MGVGFDTSKGEAEMPQQFMDIIQRGWDEMGALRGTLIETMESILTGGQFGAQVPMIARAEERQRSATNQAMRETEESLAQHGQAGTPFAETILAQQRQTGAGQQANIGESILSSIFGIIPGFVQGQSGSVMGATPGTRTQDSSSKGGQFSMRG